MQLQVRWRRPVGSSGCDGTDLPRARRAGCLRSALEAHRVEPVDPLDDGHLELGSGAPQAVELHELGLEVSMSASAIALSYASPLAPTDAATQASASRSLQRNLVYWQPRPRVVDRLHWPVRDSAPLWNQASLVCQETPGEISSNRGNGESMRLLDLLTLFDDALEWQLDDALLADHQPSDEIEDPWPLTWDPVS